MRARGLGRLLAIAACAAIALAVMVSDASAKPGYYVLTPGFYLEFVVRGSVGHRIEVSGAGESVEVKVRRGGILKTSYEATYTVPGYAHGSVLRANLGSFGRIDLRFHPKSQESVGPIRRCRGKASEIEEGSFEGIVRFRGEGGYTRFSANRVRGWAWREFHRVCKRPDWLLPDSDDGRKPDQERKDEDEDVTVLGASSSGRARSTSLRFVSFDSQDNRGFSFSLARAGIEERRGRIAVERSVTVPADGSLLYGPAGGRRPSATLHLPPPFAGSATYDLANDPTWFGSLRVRLPGTSAIPLAGASFAAGICKAPNLEVAIRCLP